MASTNVRVSEKARAWIIRQAGIRQTITGAECTAGEIVDYLIVDWQKKSKCTDLFELNKSFLCKNGEPVV